MDSHVGDIKIFLVELDMERAIMNIYHHRSAKMLPLVLLAFS